MSTEIETRELVNEQEGVPVAEADNADGMHNAESDDVAIEAHDDIESSDTVVVDADEDVLDDDGLDEEADELLADAEDAAAEID